MMMVMMKIIIIIIIIITFDLICEVRAAEQVRVASSELIITSIGPVTQYLCAWPRDTTTATSGNWCVIYVGERLAFQTYKSPMV